MDSAECNLSLGLILGILISGLLVGGSMQAKTAIGKIKGFKKDKEKAGEEIKKAREKRRKGFDELVGAVLIILAGIILFVLTLYLLMQNQGF